MVVARHYTEAECRAIDKHMNRMIRAANKAKRKLSEVPRDDRSEWVSKNIGYWAHAVSAYQWAKTRARPKKRGSDNAKRKGVRRARCNS